MGYIAAFVIGFVLLIAFAVVAASNRRPKQGRISSGGTAILREEPSADAPTPGRSVTATKSEVNKAGKQTPPA